MTTPRTGKPQAAATYESSHGATRRITAAARLVEMVCERIAAHEGRTLPARFWNTPEWQDAFRRQTVFAHSLLKLFDPESIMRAFRANRSVRSLGASFFFEQLQSAQRTIDADLKRAADATDTPAFDASRAPRPGRPPSSTRARLNRMDGNDGEAAGQIV